MTDALYRVHLFKTDLEYPKILISIRLSKNYIYRLSI